MIRTSAGKPRGHTAGADDLGYGQLAAPRNLLAPRAQTPAEHDTTGGHPGLDASRVTPGHGRRPPSSRVNAARTAPFAARWPHQSFLDLGALPGAVPCARLHARHVLGEWGLAEISDSTELVVSELVTNGIAASRAMSRDTVRLWLVSDRGRVVVFVWDASPQPPVPARPDLDAENGRGLLLVQAVSERWGHFGYYGGGKVVWASLPV